MCLSDFKNCYLFWVCVHTHVYVYEYVCLGVHVEIRTTFVYYQLSLTFYGSPGFELTSPGWHGPLLYPLNQFVCP